MPTSTARPMWLKGLSLLLALAPLTFIAACSATSAGEETTPTATLAPTATAAASPTSSGGGSGIEVKVFFSNIPKPIAVSRPSSPSSASRRPPAWRPTPCSSSSPDQRRPRRLGYFTELTASLTGASNCGADFQITLNTHIDTHTGTPSTQTGTAVLKFCRATQLAGDLVGPRIRAELDATLKQFPTITKTQILTNTGHCFDDASGQDNC